MPPLWDCVTQRRIRSSRAAWAVNPKLQKTFLLLLDWKATVLLFLGLSWGKRGQGELCPALTVFQLRRAGRLVLVSGFPPVSVMFERWGQGLTLFSPIDSLHLCGEA